MAVCEQDGDRRHVPAEQGFARPFDPRTVTRPARIDQNPRRPRAHEVHVRLRPAPRPQAVHVRRDLLPHDAQLLVGAGADVGDLGRAELGHRPVAGKAADVADEVGEQPAAVRRVHDLGVEHRRVVAPPFVDRDRIVIGGQSRGGILSVAYLIGVAFGPTGTILIMTGHERAAAWGGTTSLDFFVDGALFPVTTG